MRNNQDKGRRDQTGRGVSNPVAGPPVYTAEQRETARRGLRILAKIIARGHLRRQADRSSEAAPGSPPRKPGSEPCTNANCLLLALLRLPMIP